MFLKKVDERVGALLHHAVTSHHRAFLVVVGDRGKDLVVNLHVVRSKITFGAKPSVLWCYKDDLGFTTHKLKKIKQIKKKQARGNYDYDTEDPFWLFQQNTELRYCRYRDCKKILGTTFDMCILQDFEALSPNILCTTMECAAGGGIVILLLKNISSLKQLYSTVMDGHKKFDVANSLGLQTRHTFTQRLIHSLTDCGNCLVVDDELNVLPISKKQVALIPPLPEDALALSMTKQLSFDSPQLASLKEEFKDDKMLAPIIDLCRTFDQAKCVSTAAEYIMKTTPVVDGSVVAFTAARGRGKSAAMGLSVAMGLYNGLSNVVVCAPSPENVGAVFDFVCRGLTAFGFKENKDFSRRLLHAESISEETKIQDAAKITALEHLGSRKVVCEIVLHRPEEAEQRIRFVFPFTFSQECAGEKIDLVIIDEAAALPIKLVEEDLLRADVPVTLLASTTDGYEGTGLALSTVFFKKMKTLANARAQEGYLPTYKRMKAEDPIRYGAGDPLEMWLKRVLCLDTAHIPALSTTGNSGYELMHVNRNALFSFHPTSEKLLTSMMSLFAAASHKTSPDDLLRMCDSAVEDLFVLVAKDADGKPTTDVLCVVEVNYEGCAEVRKNLVLNDESANYISWSVSNYFPDSDFATLVGARIRRIVTHPQRRRQGYGKLAVEQIKEYLKKGKQEESPAAEEEVDSTFLLEPLKECKPPVDSDWVGGVIELNEEQYEFMNASKFHPVHTSLSASDVTGLFSCIMVAQLRDVSESNALWVDPFCINFGQRFLSWIPDKYRTIPAKLIARVLGHCQQTKQALQATTTKAIIPQISSEMVSSITGIVNCVQPATGCVCRTASVKSSPIFAFFLQKSTLLKEQAISRVARLDKRLRTITSLKEVEELVQENVDLYTLAAFFYFRGHIEISDVSQLEQIILLGIAFQRKKGGINMLERATYEKISECCSCNIHDRPNSFLLQCRKSWRKIRILP